MPSTLRRLTTKRRLESLERMLGVEYDSFYGRHRVAYSKVGEIQELRARVRFNWDKVAKLLAHLGLTEVTYPEKTVIEKIKKRR